MTPTETAHVEALLGEMFELMNQWGKALGARMDSVEFNNLVNMKIYDLRKRARVLLNQVEE